MPLHTSLLQAFCITRMDAQGEVPKLRDQNSTAVQSVLGINWAEMQRLKKWIFHFLTLIKLTDTKFRSFIALASEGSKAVSHKQGAGTAAGKATAACMPSIYLCQRAVEGKMPHSGAVKMALPPQLSRRTYALKHTSLLSKPVHKYYEGNYTSRAGSHPPKLRRRELLT
jgi:hypothetical protein